MNTRSKLFVLAALAAAASSASWAVLAMNPTKSEASPPKKSEASPPKKSEASPLDEQRATLIRVLNANHGLTPDQTASIEGILSRSTVAGQGNPSVTNHPMTREECRAIRKAAGVSKSNPDFQRICKAPHMAPLYDAATQKPEDATACIDQYEFPDVPCEYPVVWVKAKEAAQLCEAMGKRLCDAHEWEGACEGRLTDADYRFDLARGKGLGDGARAMRRAHNAAYAGKETWSYGGDAYQKGVCAAASSKDKACNGGSFRDCGSNTYPTGSFPGCRSTLGVYDLHGNAAEHMNLPLSADQMTSSGSKTLGVTEMKGSWFIFDKVYAHEDWCRWRAPFWHGTRVMSDASHENYHLGFRCCKSLPAQQRNPVE